MSYLLDTDWAIQALGGRQPAVATLQRLAGSRVALSIVTLGELYERAFESPNPQAYIASFRDFWHLYHLLPLTEPITDVQHSSFPTRPRAHTLPAELITYHPARRDYLLAVAPSAKKGGILGHA